MPSGALGAGGGRLGRSYDSRPAGQPPVGKTGVQRTTGLDWITATVKGRTVEEVRELVTEWFGPTSPRAGGARFYLSSEKLGEHSLLAWDGVGDAGGTVMLSIAGSEMRGLDGDAQLQLLAALDLAGFRVSRVDPYVDDWDCVVRPGEAREALIAGDVVTRTKGIGELLSDRRGWETLYVGSRQSGAFLRAYEKAGPEGLPERGARADGPARVRWELELKGEAARAYVAALLAAPAGQVALFWGTVRALVDFRARGGRERAHGERAELLPWWRELTGSAERVRRAVAEVVRGLDERAGWVMTQVSRTLAAVWLARGDGWVSQVLGEGMERLDARDRWQLAAVGVRTGP